MRHPYSIFVFVVIIITCAFATPAEQDRSKNDSAVLTHLPLTPHSFAQQIRVSPQIDTNSGWNAFISMFSDTISDTLQLFMYEAWIERINEYVHYTISKEKFAENLVFKGKLIDDTLLKFIQPGDLEHEYNQSISYYAVNRILFDSSHTCLTLRLYSEAAPHIVNFLYVYMFDKNHRLLHKILVADDVGDEGYFEQVQSWVTDLNSDGIKEIVTRRDAINYDGDQEEKSISLTVRRFSDAKFVEEMQPNKSILKEKFILRQNGVVYH